MIGAFQCVAHVLGHGPGHEQYVGRARRGNEPEAEALDIVVGVVKRGAFDIESIERYSVDLAYREASAEPPPRCATNSCCKFCHRGIVGRRRLLREWPAKQAFKKQLAHLVLSLEILARIGAVERLVAERKVLNDIALDGSFKERPLKPQRVAHVASFDPTIPQPQPNQDVAAKSLDDRPAFPRLTKLSRLC